MAELESFEVAKGDTFGDLLSKDRIQSSEKLKIGLLAGGFFEYWRMYPGTLKETIEKDNQVVLERLRKTTVKNEAQFGTILSVPRLTEY